MTYQYLNSETPAERFLWVRLEQPRHGDAEYGHIVATVVRRAVPHLVIEEGKIATYYDGPVETATGYRNCGWSKSTTGASYVADMELRGQFDKTPRPLRDGRPYGNELRFKPYEVKLQAAVAMAATLTKWDKYCEKHGQQYDGVFTKKVALLAQMLKIDTLLLSNKPGIVDLSNRLNFVETTVPMGVLEIEEILAPFVNKEVEA